MLFSVVFTINVKNSEAAVASNFKAAVMGPLSQVTDWNAFKSQLQTLKNNNVYAITQDVWWGLVEGAGDNQFDWSYYKQYASVVKEVGLKWIPIISTHKCGDNVGDACFVEIPSWIWSKGTADEMKVKSETGYVNSEAVSPLWSGVGQQYKELYSAFAAAFSEYKSIIPKIYLSGGPSGELRFPSYYPPAGWSYPSRGKFQVYSESAKQAFRTAMKTKYGSLSGINAAWGTSLTNESQINPPSDGDGFYTSGGYNSAYGKDFLSWYQGVLENHLGVIAQAAHESFDPVFNVPIGAKISGVHWQMTNPTMPHSAEQSAGYYDYNRLIQKFKDTNMDLTFTCLEMYDSGSAPNYNMPSTLVDQVSAIANSKGVRLNGENALPVGGSGGFSKIEEKLTKYGYTGFTLLRINNVVNSDGSATGEMANFKNYVAKYSTADDNTVPNSVTVYYKKGFATPYMHYRPAGGTWTTAPGVAMANSDVSGYAALTVDIGSATQLEAAFNNGSGTWDSNATKNYLFGVGTFTYTPGANGAAGTITSGKPSGDAGTGANTATIYYKKGFATPYAHYRVAGGTWTTAPGAAMAQSDVTGYASITIPLGSAATVEVAFNNGSGTWDSNNSQNYIFPTGTSTYTPGTNGAAGTITSGKPSGNTGTGTNAATIYYKKGFATPYAHYRVAGGTWTTAPGTAMADSDVSGYASITIALGGATSVEVAFNNGSGTWDSNNQQNYIFQAGTSTYTPGTNGAAGTITSDKPSVDPGTGNGGGGTPVDLADWSTKSIYFIMTDRFVNGDPSNDNYGGFNANKSDMSKWHGGDFQGIINNLDYIKNMGFNAIWITPVQMQRSENAYHGYHTYDFYAIDGHLGTMAKFQELVSTAHNKGIAVMLDVVLNHTGDFNNSGYAKAPFNNADWYHHNGDITGADYNSNNQWKIENGDVAGLDDLNQENPAVMSELKNWIGWLKRESGVDGLRVDTAKHVPKWALREFDAAANTFTIGEVFSGDAGYVGGYSNYLDAVLDFPMYYTMKDVFGSDASMTLIRDRYAQDVNYRDTKVNGLFLDNHDVKRFLNTATGNPSNRSDKWPQLKAALGFMFTSRGIPIVYQGTELGYSGGDDPNNREDVVPNANHELYKYIAKLNGVRNGHPALQNGTQKEKAADSAFYAFQRSKEGDEAVVLINNSWSSQTKTIGNLENLASGTQLRNQLGSDTLTVNNGSITATLGPKEIKVFTK
ncbi:family 14 glycosylhydrolase [Paenibacillus aurantiacus]|uniref:Family 14 glycosylhydrolase n=1 Tax=Paenibacillus aurantiacus TaxID=1936118 RepID=A0ABV5KSW3_9BACL